MQNCRIRLATCILSALLLACVTLLFLPFQPFDGQTLFAQDGPVPPPGLGPPPAQGPGPGPAPTRRRRQVKRTPTPVSTQTPAPAQIPTQAPTAAAPQQAENSPASPALPPGPSEAVVIAGEPLVQVFGDRLTTVLYGQAGDALYRSEDNGQSWQRIVAESSVEPFIVSPADPMMLFAGSGIDCDEENAETAPFLRSDDGGVTWSQVPIGDNLVPLLAHPQDPDLLIAADCDMPYLSDDGGKGWRPKQDVSEKSLWGRYRVEAIGAATQVGDLPAGEGNWHYLYAAGTDIDGSSVVAYSGDIGDTWTRITPLINPEPRGLTALVADPTTAGRLWFADENGVWYTDDFGTSWLLTRAGFAHLLDGEDGGVTSLALAPDDILYAGTADGLYQADGSGGEWTLVEDEALQQAAIDGLLVISGETAVLWANTAEGVYRLALPAYTQE